MHTVQDLCPFVAEQRAARCASCVSRWGGTPPCAREWLRLRMQTMQLPEEPVPAREELPAAA